MSHLPAGPSGPPARRAVLRTYLEMRDPAALRAEPWSAADLRLERCDPCPVATYRELYRLVGARWAWRDRDAWTDERLAAYLARPDVAVWVVRDAAGAPGGYFELARLADASVEIAYFGLAERLHGRRLGAQLLTAAVRQAWASGAGRVCVNTCTLDAPAALPNYLARGFTVYARDTYWTDAPQPPSSAPAAPGDNGGRDSSTRPAL